MSVSFINPFLKPPPPPAPSSSLASVTDKNLFDFGNAGETAYAGFEHNQAGTLFRTYFDQPPGEIGIWLASGDPADFQVRATLTSGAALDAGSAALDTWLAGNANHQWFIQIANGLKESRLLIEWRDAATLTVLESCNVWLNVEVS